MINKEDIESLGWVYQGKDVEFPMEAYSHSSWNGFNLQLWKDGISIERVENISNLMPRTRNTIHFVGKLITDNPKQELLTIMQQIGII